MTDEELEEDCLRNTLVAQILFEIGGLSTDDLKALLMQLEVSHAMGED